MRSGKAGALPLHLGLEVLSQWSLTFEVRKSGIMTTILGVITGSQWSLTFEVRKRAEAFWPFW